MQRNKAFTYMETIFAIALLVVVGFVVKDLVFHLFKYAFYAGIIGILVLIIWVLHRSNQPPTK